MVGRIKAPAGFRFEKGIVSIVGNEAKSHLPSRSALTPGSEQLARSKVADILYGDSLDEALASFFRPVTADPSLTQRGRYRQVLQSTVDTLYKKSRGKRRGRQVCVRAADILMDLGDIHDELVVRRSGGWEGS